MNHCDAKSARFVKPMKRLTALRNLREIERRLHVVNGILATPNCERDAYRVSRVWVFGSVAKGSETPNDVDVMIEGREVGRFHRWCRGRVLDKRYRHACGMSTAPASRQAFLVWLTKGMKKVSRHCTESDAVELDVKYLIYPRWEMPAERHASRSSKRSS